MRIFLSIFLFPILASAQTTVTNLTKNSAVKIGTAFSSIISGGAAAIPVDLLFQWTGANGARLTTNIAVASEIGSDKGVITYSTSNGDPLGHTFVTNHAFTTLSPFSVGGSSYSSFSQAVIFSADVATNWDSISWAPSGSYSNLSVGFVFYPNFGGTAANYDLVNIASVAGTYAVAEFLMPDTTGYFAAHGDFGGTTKLQSTDKLANNVPVQVTLRFNGITREADVFVVNATNGVFLGASHTNTTTDTVAYALLQDYLWLAGSTGNGTIQYWAFDWTHAAMPLGPTPTIPAVTNLTVTELETNSVHVSWNGPPSDFIVERNSGSGFVVLGTNTLRSPVDFVDTNTTVGTTYTYRVTAKAFQYLATATTASPIIVQAWQGNISPVGINSSQGSDTSVWLAGTNIVANGGTLRALRVWTTAGFTGGGGPTHVKLAAYSASGTTLCTSAEVSFPVGGTRAAGWVIAPVVSGPTIAANTVYRIGAACDVSGGETWGLNTGGGLLYFNNATATYGGFPGASFSEAGSVADDMPVGMLIY